MKVGQNNLIPNATRESEHQMNRRDEFHIMKIRPIHDLLIDGVPRGPFFYCLFTVHDALLEREKKLL